MKCTLYTDLRLLDKAGGNLGFRNNNKRVHGFNSGGEGGENKQRVVGSVNIEVSSSPRTSFLLLNLPPKSLDTVLPFHSALNIEHINHPYCTHWII